MAVPLKPNFFPYANAAFCRPNWMPSERVQSYAGAMEDIQQEKRNRHQGIMNSKVAQANAADTSQELQSRLQMVKRQEQACNCHPMPAGAPRSVLQPTAAPVEPLRPGGDVGGWLSARMKELEEGTKAIVDPVVDKAAQAIGATSCAILDQLGIKEEAQEMGALFEEALGHRKGHNKAWTVFADVTIGGVPFFFSELFRTCDFGPALKDYAAIEARRMGIYKVIFKLVAVGGAMSIVGMPAAPVSTAAAGLAASLQVFWLTVAQGNWISAQQVFNIFTSLAEFQAMAGDGNETDLDPKIIEAIETAQDVKDATDKTQAALADLAETAEQLQMLEREMLGLGEFAKSGSIDPQNVSIQPSPWTPEFSIFPTFSPNPLIVRPTLITPPAAQPTYYEIETPPAPKKEAGAALPLLGLGLLFEVL
jgi:hypothetical protein